MVNFMNNAVQLDNVTRLSDPTDKPIGLGVLRAMASIQRMLAANGISKTRDTNSTQEKYKFKFRGIEDIYNTISPLMAEHGIIVVPKVINKQEFDYPDGHGKVAHRVIVTVQYTFVCVEDGSTFEAVTLGEAIDNGDKATIKAMSLAQKSLFIQTFAIPTYDPPPVRNDNRNNGNQKNQRGNYQNSGYNQAQNQAQSNQNSFQNEKPNKQMLDAFEKTLTSTGISLERFLKKRNLNSLNQINMNMLLTETKALENYIQAATHQRRS